MKSVKITIDVFVSLGRKAVLPFSWNAVTILNSAPDCVKEGTSDHVCNHLADCRSARPCV